MKEFMLKAWEFLNDPLPIVGVSILFILIFIWKIYSSSSVGVKQLNKIKKDFERTENAVDEKIKHLEEKLKQLESENEKLKHIISELMSIIPNKKVLALRGKYYGEKIDCQAEEK